MEPRLSGLGVLSAAFPFGEVRGHTSIFQQPDPALKAR